MDQKQAWHRPVALLPMSRREVVIVRKVEDLLQFIANHSSINGQTEFEKPIDVHIIIDSEEPTKVEVRV